MSNGDQHQFKDRYMLRLPDGMRDRIKAAAAENNRSMNAEIVHILEQHFTPSPENEVVITPKGGADAIEAFMSSRPDLTEPLLEALGALLDGLERASKK